MILYYYWLIVTVANSLWNNLLQPVGRKQITETRLFDYFICPTEENPYIFTKRNSLSTYLWLFRDIMLIFLSRLEFGLIFKCQILFVSY